MKILEEIRNEVEKEMGRLTGSMKINKYVKITP